MKIYSGPGVTTAPTGCILAYVLKCNPAPVQMPFSVLAAYLW